MLTAAIEMIATSSVGTMIRLRFSIRARPSACKSRSPDCGPAAAVAATGFETAGFETAGFATIGVAMAGAGVPTAPLHHVLHLACTPERQRIAHSRGPHDPNSTDAITLH